MIQNKGQPFTQPKPLKKPISQWFISLAVATALVTGATYIYNLLRDRSAAQSPVPNAQGQSSEIDAVAALGRLEPQGEITRLSSPASLEGTRIGQLLVKEGSKVLKGQVVAILDSYDPRLAAFEKAKADVQVSRANLAIVQAGAKQGDINAQDAKFQGTQAELEGQMITQRSTIANLVAQLQGEKSTQEATIEKIKAELRNAATDCKRYETLYQDGAVSVQERDRICLQEETTEKSLQEARANLTRIVSTLNDQINEAKANLNRTVTTLQRQIKEERATLEAVAEVRPVDVQLAQAELTKALAAATQAKAELALTYIRSPINGQVLKVHVRPGEVISSKGIAELGQTDQMYVVAEVYETDIRKVRVGQKVIITGEAFLGKLQGEVVRTGLQVNQQNVFEDNPLVDTDNKVIEVKIRLDPASSQKVAGFSNLQVQVVIQV